jgi:hypothetical protein
MHGIYIVFLLLGIFAEIFNLRQKVMLSLALFSCTVPVICACIAMFIGQMNGLEVLGISTIGCWITDWIVNRENRLMGIDTV